MDPQRKKWTDRYPELGKDSEALLSLVIVMLMVVLLECANV